MVVILENVDDIETDFDTILNDNATYYAICCEPFEVAYDANGGYMSNEEGKMITP